MVQKQTDQIISRPEKFSFPLKATLLFLAVVLPIVLSLLGIDKLILVIPLLVGPLILMYLFNDLGFVLGLFVFWGTLIWMGWGSDDPEEVDNMIPGLLISLGWMPYVLFYGPVFLLSKSTERYRAKWAGTGSANAHGEDH